MNFQNIQVGKIQKSPQFTPSDTQLTLGSDGTGILAWKLPKSTISVGKYTMYTWILWVGAGLRFQSVLFSCSPGIGEEMIQFDYGFLTTNLKSYKHLVCWGFVSIPRMQLPCEKWKHHSNPLSKNVKYLDLQFAVLFWGEQTEMWQHLPQWRQCNLSSAAFSVRNNALRSLIAAVGVDFE